MSNHRGSIRFTGSAKICACNGVMRLHKLLFPGLRVRGNSVPALDL